MKIWCKCDQCGLIQLVPVTAKECSYCGGELYEVSESVVWKTYYLTPTKPQDWYEEKIEEPIRPLVKLLRDNGFNTISSCGHKMYVDMEQYTDEDATRLFHLLWDNGYRHFRIITWWEVRESFSWNERSMRVEILEDKDGRKSIPDDKTQWKT